MNERRRSATPVLLLLALAALLSSCASQQVCRDRNGQTYTSPPYDYEPGNECMGTGGPGEAAMTAAGAMLLTTGRCTQASGCPGPNHCNASTGWCERISCGPLKPCPQSYRCDAGLCR